MEPPIFVPMPGFTVQQTVYLQAYISASVNISMDWRPSLNAAFNKQFGLPPLQPLPPLPVQSWYQPTPPAPQEAQKEVEQVKKQPLHQATVEDDTESTMESTTKHGSGMAVNTSTLSTIPRLCAARSSGNSAACPSNLLASSLASFFGDFLTSFFALTSFGYIECMEGMEATGQGWMLHCSRKAGKEDDWSGIQPYQSSFDSAIPRTWCHSPCFHGFVLFSTDLPAEKEAPKALVFSDFSRLCLHHCSPSIIRHSTPRYRYLAVAISPCGHGFFSFLRALLRIPFTDLSDIPVLSALAWCGASWGGFLL